MEMTGTTSRRLSLVAFTAAGVNLAAGLVMLTILRPGLPGQQALADRIAYVSEHTTAWRLGWAVWNAAAITLVGLFVALAYLWRGRAPVASRLALLCAAAGLAADLAAEALLMGVEPGLGPDDFAVVERASLVLTGYVGNGLYTVAGIILTWTGRRELPRPLVVLAVAVWGAGLWLSVATMVGSTAGQFASTALLLPLFVAWAGLVGRWLSRRGS